MFARFAAPLVDSGRIRLLPAPEVVETLPKLYDIVGRDHVGAISRPSGLWHSYFGDFRSQPLSSERWVAVHENAAGNPDGYLDYEATDRDRWSEAGNIVAVNDLLALNPVAYGALWNFVLNQDLIAVVTADERPLDEPLRHLLADPRRLETQSVVDEQWLRLIDVAGALAARTFTGAAAVALAIQDANFADNTGTYVVADGSARRDDDARPELSLGVSALGAAYLGGVSFAELAMAGQVIEHSGGALKRADAAFAVRPLAWCGSFF